MYMYMYTNIQITKRTLLGSDWSGNILQFRSNVWSQIFGPHFVTGKRNPPPDFEPLDIQHRLTTLATCIRHIHPYPPDHIIPSEPWHFHMLLRYLIPSLRPPISPWYAARAAPCHHGSRPLQSYDATVTWRCPGAHGVISSTITIGGW